MIFFLNILHNFQQFKAENIFSCILMTLKKLLIELNWDALQVKPQISDTPKPFIKSANNITLAHDAQLRTTACVQQ